MRGVIRAFEYYAGAADKLEGARLPLAKDYIGFTLDEPAGVAAQIIPWNYPLSTAAAASPGARRRLHDRRQARRADAVHCPHAGGARPPRRLPAGVLNVVTGTGARTGAPLVAHPGIDHITFTGSVATGIRVMHAAAENVTRLVLELGGKSPLVVLADADLDAALDGVIEAIYENAGQICSAGSRLVLDRRIADGFLDRLVTRTRALRLGHGLDDVDVGPVNSALQLGRIDEHVRRAKAAGNDILCGGDIVHPAGANGGWFFAPTIVAARGTSDPIVTEEIFGPVLAVQTVDDLDEAITIANCTDYALVAGIYTSDLNKATRFARNVDAGQVFVNEYFAGGIEVPFGGNRKSGFGREKGMEGLRSYCRTKSVVMRLR